MERLCDHRLMLMVGVCALIDTDSALSCCDCGSVRMYMHVCACAVFVLTRLNVYVLIQFHECTFTRVYAYTSIGVFVRTIYKLM